jgi:hypothetical protein
VTLRLIPDEPDDRMSANPEGEHEDPRGASYDATTAPRSRAKASGPTHFAIVERPGPAPAGTIGTAGKTCRECREPAVILHADPRNNQPERVMCGHCQGRINREIVGWPRGEGGRS